jgi:uncharacterized protein
MPDMGEQLALDATARTYDADGHLRISKSHISKATVNPYFGNEIPGYERLGLEGNKVYYLFRDPIELARAASTFAGKPILSKHVPISAEQHRPDLVVGAVGSDVEFNDPYLDADVTFWDAAAIAGIETEAVREFSIAYRYTPDMTPGDYHGQRYDGVMREIVGNHLAQVESGRAGSDVMAADEDIMKTTKLGKALVITLGGMSPKLMAQDAALLALVGKASGKTINVDDLSTKLIAMDAELDPKRVSDTIGAILALDKKAKDEDPDGDPAQDEEHPKDCDCAKCEKTAQDAEEEKEEKDKKAMDAAIDSRVKVIRRDLLEANEARIAVRDVVGDVAMDSAGEIYGFALDEMKVDHKGVTGTAALRALFTLANTKTAAAPAPRIAMDAAGVTARFPNANRFRLQ